LPHSGTADGLGDAGVGIRDRHVIAPYRVRIETVSAWMLVGFSLLTLGTLLYISQVAARLAMFITAMGLVYFAIGLVLGVVHNKHMIKRTRAGWSENE
jgi:hypothetical protein